jgi:tetratricopeptide (TPR) repeat protein
MSTHIDNIEHIENAHFHNSDKPSLPSNIPSPKGFIGREIELAALRQAKTGSKTSFVLHGIGGVGKTDLALKFIEEIKADYSAHIHVDMRGLSDKPPTANYAKLEVIRMFKPDVPANLEDKDINNLYISLLNHHKTILFFDNTKDREQVEPLNNTSALVVITSRDTFNVTGGFNTKIDKMSLADARELLYSVADEERFDGQADALAYLAGYLPMALLPLASILADDITLKAVDLVDKYEKRKAERLQLADPNRENLTVMASFDLSYERLSEELQTCWRKLAVFPADFDLEAMQAVWQIEDGKQFRSELIKKHLLEFDEDTERSHLHDLTRDYTREKLIEKERSQTLFFHCVYFGNLLVSFHNISLDKLNKFDEEWLNIKQGFYWLTDKVEVNTIFADLCNNYTSVASDILFLRLHPKDFIYWNEIGLKAAQRFVNTKRVCICLGNIGSCFQRLSQYNRAIDIHRQTFIISKEENDLRGIVTSLGNMALAYDSLGDLKTSLKLHEDIIPILEKIDDCSIKVAYLVNIGRTYDKLGIDRNPRYFDDAENYFNQGLIIANENNLKQQESTILVNLGTICSQRKDYLGSKVYYLKSLKICEDFNDLEGKAAALGNLGITNVALGEYGDAIENYRNAIEFSEMSGNLDGQGLWTANLGIALINKSAESRNEGINLIKKGLRILELVGSSDAKFFQENLVKFEQFIRN